MLLRNRAMMIIRSLATLAALATVGCAMDSGDARVTTADLAASPATYVGEAHWFEGSVEVGSFACSLRECGASGPCNDCLAPFVIGDPEVAPDAIALVAGDGYALEIGEHLALGCEGDEEEMACLPAVPSRIVAVSGTVQPASGLPEVLSAHEWMLVVDAVELADGPSEETVSGVRLTEE